jgi:hypothetical protein
MNGYVSVNLTKITMGKVTMDELDFLRLYNAAVKASNEGQTAEFHRLILSLLNGLNDRITELQLDDPDDPEDE